MKLLCARCGISTSFDPRRLRCDCGAALALLDAPAFDPAQVLETERTLWRYRHALPLPPGVMPVTLGEGMTPLVPADWAGLTIWLKCEHLNPTGSFKDRGTTLLATALAGAGVDQVVEDSSGNAGSSLAAYAARAGIEATVYVPAHASSVKQAQIAAYGAQVITVPGPRIEAARAVQRAVDGGATYASHVHHPLVTHGMKTIAFELVEQLGAAPQAVLVPVGHGTLLLGLAQGFAELQAAGCIERLPRLVGAQAAMCAPIAAAWARGEEEADPVDEGETAAEGARIAAPVHSRAVLAAVRRSGGELVAVPEAEILTAQQRLAHQGFYVEPTSALPLAALDRLTRTGSGAIAIVLTGSGFKSP